MILCVLVFMWSCTQEDSKDDAFKNQDIFTALMPEETGITFQNDLPINDTMNYFSYGYYYMGGGVAVADFDGNGLTDIFFTSNAASNELYLNDGDFKFSNITKEAGLARTGYWHTGCAVVDINADAKPDIYVSVAGKWNDRSNLLYINQGPDENGIPIFEEKAKEYGLDDNGYSIQTTFFDYDQDGDLDVYVANYPPTAFNSTVQDYISRSKNFKWEESDHLYENKGNNIFEDITEKAGLLRFGLGIGVIAQDFNNDNLTDLYVSNDFHTPDFFYLNKGDGTFTESLKECFQQTSFYGMGVDVADIDNNGYKDLMQVDMTSQDNYRSKANMASMNIPAFQAMIENGLHYQYMYNSLQVCQGVREDGQPFYSNVSKAYGLDMTEWSWACLFTDCDNDGDEDLFVTNGVRKDINNKDFFKWLKQTDTKLKIKYKEMSFKQLTDKMPEEKSQNVVYENINGELAKVGNNWGLDFAGFSNGAAYADLDNDGGMELIVNNIDSMAVIFRNNHSINNYLKLSLKGPEKNTMALGTKVSLYVNGKQQSKEHTLVRGYQSSIDPIINFGLGQAEKVDSLIVHWPNGKMTKKKDVPANQLLVLNCLEEVNMTAAHSAPISKPYLTQVEDSFLDWVHKENRYDDYKREVLLPHAMSSFGPGVEVADINNDGRDDVVLTGAKDSPSVVFYNSDSGFSKQQISGPEKEDVQILAVDLLGNGIKELIVVSGGNEVDDLSDSYYTQRIYKDGVEEVVDFDAPQLSASCVAVTDIDGDGHKEIFYGSRLVPGNYPQSSSSHIYTTKNGQIAKASSTYIQGVEKLGMVTDALFTDYDGDGDDDLLAVGEWMAPTFYKNENGVLKLDTKRGVSNQVGWWTDIVEGDFDSDGDQDYVLTNLGLNYKYKIKEGETFDCFANDFDENNDLDIVLGYYQDGKQYPVRGRQCSSEQMPELSQKFRNYHTFASASLSDIYTPKKLKESLHLKANQFNHIYLENNNGAFEVRKLPMEFQLSSYNKAVPFDINRDGHLDLIMAGNIFDSEAETPRADSEFGTIALGDGLGNFRKCSFEESGLYIPYETRDIAVLKTKEDVYFLFANNNAPLSIYKLN